MHWTRSTYFQTNSQEVKASVSLVWSTIRIPNFRSCKDIEQYINKPDDRKSSAFRTKNKTNFTPKPKFPNQQRNIIFFCWPMRSNEPTNNQHFFFIFLGQVATKPNHSTEESRGFVRPWSNCQLKLILIIVEWGTNKHCNYDVITS